MVNKNTQEDTLKEYHEGLRLYCKQNPQWETVKDFNKGLRLHGEQEYSMEYKSLEKTPSRPDNVGIGRLVCRSKNANFPITHQSLHHKARCSL